MFRNLPNRHFDFGTVNLIFFLKYTHLSFFVDFGKMQIIK